jgi:hypothetical protein
MSIYFYINFVKVHMALLSKNLILETRFGIKGVENMVDDKLVPFLFFLF